LFSYFYAFIQVNPEQIAENLKKQGGYVPGIRPGKATEKYFSNVLVRLTFVGSIFLVVIACTPMFLVAVANLFFSVTVGGTSMLIVVGVVFDTLKQLEGQVVERNYKGFIK
jgi:preprotein translocase subunit SecY